MISIGLYRGRWHLYSDNKRCAANWKTQDEASAFMWKLVTAREDAQ